MIQSWADGTHGELVLEAAVRPPALGQLFSFAGSFLDLEARPGTRTKIRNWVPLAS